MKKSAHKKTSRKAPVKRAHPLHKEVPTLNAFVIIFYILIGILFVGLFFSKMG